MNLNIRRRLVAGIATVAALGTIVIRMARSARRAVVGDLHELLDLDHKGDELGELSSAMTALYLHLQSMVIMADRMGGGDVTAGVKPRSEADSFGLAFRSMMHKLNESMGEVRSAASALAASGQVPSTALQIVPVLAIPQSFPTSLRGIHTHKVITYLSFEHPTTRSGK
jgi:methyl-accepting chemotaxis protein